MKPEKLTISHKNKLYKMCFDLFTEHSMIMDGLIDDKRNKHIGEHVFCWFYHNNKNKDFYIHWYELCCTLLPKKIFREDAWNTNTSKIASYYEHETKIHIVDWLYENFKCLSKSNLKLKNK